MPDNDISTGEVHRLFKDLQQDVRDLRDAFIGRPEYEADQEGIDRRFEESGKVHTQLEAKVAAVDTKVDAKVEALELKVEATEKEQRANRSKWQLALVMAGVSMVLSIVGGLLIEVIRT